MSSSGKTVRLNNAHSRRKPPAIRGAILDLCSSDEDSDRFQDLRTRISKRQSKSNKSAPSEQNALVAMLPLIDISFPSKDNKKKAKPPKPSIEKKKVKKKTIAKTKTAKKGFAAIAKERRKAQKNAGDVRLCSVQLCRADFISERDQYTLWYFERLNTGAFDDSLVLNANLTYSWCTTLNKTAGDCRLRTIKTSNGRGKHGTRRRTAHIRLATKILDSLDRLKQTLCHEMCHAMAWIADSNTKPPHGPRFRHWADKSENRFSDLNVTTCHNYKIEYKFQWQCTNAECKHIYGRHSKSIKIDTHRCGVCKGTLEFMGRRKADGSFTKPKKDAAARKPSAFTLFMKQHMGSLKKMYPRAKHKEIMKILSRQYKLQKERAAGNQTQSKKKDKKSNAKK